MKTIKKSKITRITIARLYSLGNYEHVRYEITAEVPQGGSAKQTLLDIGSIIACLKPVKKPYNYDSALETISKIPEQMSEMEKANRTELAEIVDGYNGLKARREAALLKLDDIGGVSKTGGGKRVDSDDDDGCMS